MSRELTRVIVTRPSPREGLACRNFHFLPPYSHYNIFVEKENQLLPFSIACINFDEEDWTALMKFVEYREIYYNLFVFVLKKRKAAERCISWAYLLYLPLFIFFLLLLFKIIVRMEDQIHHCTNRLQEDAS